MHLQCRFAVTVNLVRANHRNQNQKKSQLHNLTTWLQVEPARWGNVTASIASQESLDFTKCTKQLLTGLFRSAQCLIKYFPSQMTNICKSAYCGLRKWIFFPMFLICGTAVLRRKTLWKWPSWRTSRTPATWSSSDRDTSTSSWCLPMPPRLPYSGNLPKRFFPSPGKSWECFTSSLDSIYYLSLFKKLTGLEQHTLQFNSMPA